jgi:type I restriction enzyme, S subunit
MSEVSTEGTFFNGVIADIAEINPRTDIALAEEERVSFLPMQSTSESGDIIALQERVFAQVSKGYTRFAENDVLVAKITPCFENGKGGYAKGLLNGIGFGSTEFHIVRAIPGKADSRFLHHLTRSERFRKAGEGSMTGSAGQKRIPSNFIKDFPIFIPPLPEQKKIAEILSAIDKEIAGVSQIIQGKRLFRESLLRQIIPHQSSFGDGLPPEGWNLVTIEEICSLITYGFTNPMPTSDRGIYMVTAKDVRDGKIDKGTARFTSVEAYETLLTDKSRPRRNDILVTKDGTLGRTAVVGEETICINQSVALLRPSDEQNAQFLQLLLSSPQYQETMIEESGGSAVKHIYITTLAKMPIAIPSSPERREEVVGFCYSLNKSIDILLKKHDCLSNLKKGLASDLLSGSKRVSV